VGNTPKFAKRMRDISSWQEENISSLSARAKKKYYKRKSAIKEYFTTEATIDEITQLNHISPESLMQLVERCLMLDPDGTPWGFRALLPGANVADHSPQPATEEAAEIPALPEIAEESTQTLTECSAGPTSTEADTTAPLADEEILDSKDEPTVTLAPLLAHEEATVEDSASFDEPTGTLVPLTEEEEEIPAASQEAEHTSATMEEEIIDAEEGDVEVGHVIEEATLEANMLVTGDNGEIAEPEQIEEGSPDQDETIVDETTLETEPVLLDGEETITEHLNDSDGEPHDNVPVPSDARNAIVVAVRITDDVHEEERTGLPALNGHAEEQTLLPARSNTTLVPFAPAYIRRNDTNARKVALQRRMVRKRWLRDEHTHHIKWRSLQFISLAVIATILLFILVPVSAGFAAYSAYNNISGIAHDGINHLLKVKSLLPISKSDPTAALNANNLQQAQIEFKAAEGDFVQLQQLVNRTDVQAAITQFAPQYTNKLDMAQRLVQVALDVSRMGNELSGIALIGANIIHGLPLSSGSTKPVISVADVTAIEGAMVHALYYIDDIQEQMSQVSIKDIPISDKQKQQLVSVLDLLPNARDMIVQAQGLIGIAAWLLGAGQQRRYLVQTMDRAEIRPGGGFTGQYGILQIQDGRMSPFTLKDVTLIDYAENGTAIGRTAPPGYGWMNFGNWGVRDSNLSGDFPTTARMTMQLYQDEGGGPIDGDIAFTPTLIGHILDVIGPIKVPGYNETITSKNLEERLHYYQQDFSAIAREKQISGDYSHAGRKAFTSTLGKLMLDRVRHAKVTQLIEIAKGAIKDIQSRDLEIYFTDPAAEAWLAEHGLSGSIDTFDKQDGFISVQANISISKASQYVHTTEQDSVTLDAHGGATHNLTITLNYQQRGPVYGFDTYADYIRVYAPRNAQFISGDGFDTGRPLCRPRSRGPSPKRGGSTPVPTGCSQYSSSFPSNARYCPSGNYSLGLRGGFNTPWVIDSLGSPTALRSDLAGRAMWGGLTETPKNCISYISLSWYVPHVVKKVNGQPSYTILIQKQSGYSPTIDLSINASAIKGLKSFSFHGDINVDKAFTLTPPAKKN